MDMSGVDTEREIEERDAWERRRRRFGVSALLWLLLIAVALGAAFLPRIVSLPAVRERVVARVNAAIAPATVAIGDWSFRWFGRQRLADVRFADPAQGVAFAVKEVDVSSGWVNLLPFGTVDAGRVTLEEPVVRVARARGDGTLRGVPSKGTTDLLDEAVKQTADHVKSAGLPAGRPITLPQLTVLAELVVHNGRIVAEGFADGETVLAERVNATVRLRTWDKPVELSADYIVPGGERDGTVAVTGELPPVRLLAAQAFDDPAFAGRLSLKMNGLDLRVLRPLVEAFVGAAWLERGVADAEASVQFTGLQQTALNADLAIARFSLAAPGCQPSPPEDVTLTVSAKRDAQGVAIRSCEVRSPWGKVSAEGHYETAATGAVPMGQIALTGGVDVAAIVRDFRPLLGLTPEVRVDRGTLSVAAVIAGTERARTLQFDAAANDFAVFYNDEPVRLTPSPQVSVGVVMPYTEPPELTALDIVLPFARVSGEGRLDQGKLSGQVDLTAFSRDYRKLWVACPPMVGHILFQVTAKQNGSRSEVLATVGVEDLAAEILPGKRVVIRRADHQLAFKIPLADGKPLPEASDVRLASVFDGGTVSGAVARVVLPQGDREAEISGISGAVELDLGQIAAAIHPVLPLPPGASVGGRLVANLTAEVGGGTVRSRIKAAVHGLTLQTTAWSIDEPDMRAEGSMDIAIGDGAIRLFDLALTASAAQVSVPELRLVLPRDEQGLSVSGEAVAKADLGVISGWRRPSRDGAAPARVDGKVQLQMKAEGVTAGTRLTADGTVDDLTVSAQGSGASLRVKQVTMRAAAVLAPDGNSLVVESAGLAAAEWFRTTAKGRVYDLSGAAQASLTGTVAVDYDALSAKLAALGMRGVTFSGKPGPRPFAFTGALGGGIQSLRSFGAAEGALGVGSIRVLGMELAMADMTFALDEGLLKIDYQPVVGAGAVRVTPLIQTAAEPPVLEIGGPVPILDRVPLTQEFADTLLAMINPFLRGCVVGGGFVDLTVAETHIPLVAGAEQQIDTQLSLTLREATFTAMGSLAEALDLVGIEKRMITVRETTIQAVCRNGRIQPEPFELTVDGHIVGFEGSVGLDQSVSYLIVLPMTERLVGRSVWPYVKGLKVHVPVKGTLTNLQLDKDAAKKEISRLIKEVTSKALGDAARDQLNRLLRER